MEDIPGYNNKQDFILRAMNIIAGDVRDVEKLNADVVLLERRISNVEVFGYTFWRWAENHDTSFDEASSSIDKAITAINRHKTPELVIRRCENRGKRLQDSTVFRYKCMYCGHDMIENPYGDN